MSTLKPENRCRELREGGLTAEGKPATQLLSAAATAEFPGGGQPKPVLERSHLKFSEQFSCSP